MSEDYKEDAGFVGGALLIIVGAAVNSTFMLAFGFLLFGFAFVAEIS